MATVQASPPRRRLDATWLAWLAFALLAVASIALILRAGRDLFFFGDEWAVLLHRRGLSLSTLMHPHNEHVIAVPVLTYKLLLAVFGMDSYTPYRVTVTLFHVGAAAALYAYARPRLGSWPALIPAALLLFLGAAWEDLIWAFQITFVGAVAFGLAMLVALDKRRDTLAAIALLCSLTCSGLGLPFAVIAAVEIAFDPQRRRRAWVVLVPVVIVGLAIVGYGGSTGAETAGPARTVRWALDAAAAGFGGIAGGTGLEWGRPLLIAGAAVLAYALRNRRLDPRVLGIGLGLVVYWLSTGRARAAIGQPPDTSRYVYASAALLLALFVTILPRPRLTLATALALAVGTLLACVSSQGLLRDGASTRVENATTLPARLAAIEVSGAAGNPAYKPDPQFSPDIDARSYLDAVKSFGSPAPSLAHIRTEGDPVRQQFDLGLVQALGVALNPGTETSGGGPLTIEAATQGTVSGKGACRTFTPNAPNATLDLQLSPGTYAFSADTGPAPIYTRRTAATFRGQPDFTVQSGVPSTLALPAGGLRDPWQLRVVAQNPVHVCTAA
jgi:hypothetical protein